MRVRFPSDAPDRKMKKNRLHNLIVIVPALFALSGCFFNFREVEEEITVTPPKIEVISSVKINLQGRRQKTIYPTLSNSSTKNPKYTFTSANPNIASVTAEGEITGLAVGETYINIVLQSNTDVKASVKVSVVDEVISHYDYTIMFYMCGSDLEYDASLKEEERHAFFTEDIQEILSVKDIPDEVKIIIETGGTKQWNMPSEFLEGDTNPTKISSTNLQRWEVNNITNKLRLVKTLPTNYMASEKSFEEFLSWGLDDYEADQMGVVLSGHGGGIAGCVYDDNYTVNKSGSVWQRTLRTFEVARAAEAALSNSDKEKFTWIGYDCCVMQCADIASINANYFDYMVASQENEEARGWNHDVYLPSLMNNPKIAPKEFLPKICDSFLLDKHREGESGDQVCLQTLSVLELSAASEFVESFNALTSKLGVSKASYNTAKLAFRNCDLNTFGGSIFGLADFSTYLDTLDYFDTSLDITPVENALKKLVYYKQNCSKYLTKPCGVNIFFPLSLDKDLPLQVIREDYSNRLSTEFHLWQEMCVAYGDFSWDTI